MDIETNPFKTLRQNSGMPLKMFGQYFDISYRTVQNWHEGKRACPTYLLKLMEYKLVHEGLIKEVPEESEASTTNKNNI